ncbi:MAG: Eco57I restriction-modification methylase domain-containing protein, partial [Myxococcota bacterium]
MAGFALDAGARALGCVPRRLLDPACGAGAFLAEAALRWGAHGTALCGMDSDADALAATRARLRLIAPTRLPVSLCGRDALQGIGGPRFDLVVGNPPYVRQEELGGERRKRALAARLDRALPGAGAALGRKADLSVAFLLLGLARLRPGGVLAYVTGNAWLDALYGAPLRQFLAERAEIRRVVEWEGKAFAQAAANPVVVVIRRRAGRGRQPALFTRFALRSAGERAAWVGMHRRVGIRRLASEPRWGAALLRRVDLLDEVSRRAPDAFAPLHEIAALHYGTKPGLVDFFVVDKEAGVIEKQFLVPILTSTSEISSLEVRPGSLPRRLFVCPVPRAQILAGRYAGARAHVMQGERARTRKKARHTRPGRPYPEVPSVRGNVPWYHLRPRPAGDFAIPLLIRERHMIPYAPERVAATNMFYQGRFADRTLALPGTAVLNSSVSLLALESQGRINIGGRINVYGPEIRPLRVPDPRRMKASALREIAARFGPLRARPVGAISEEMGRS